MFYTHTRTHDKSWKSAVCFSMTALPTMLYSATWIQSTNHMKTPLILVT